MQTKIATVSLTVHMGYEVRDGVGTLGFDPYRAPSPLGALESEESWFQEGTNRELAALRPLLRKRHTNPFRDVSTLYHPIIQKEKTHKSTYAYKKACDGPKLGNCS